MYQILTLNNQSGVDMPLYKQTKKFRKKLDKPFINM